MERIHIKKFEFDEKMGISICDSSTGGCTEQTLQVSFDAADMYQFDEEITITANDEFVFNTILQENFLFFRVSWNGF